MYISTSLKKVNLNQGITNLVKDALLARFAVKYPITQLFKVKYEETN
jgi:hypothetical protein